MIIPHLSEGMNFISSTGGSLIPEITFNLDKIPQVKKARLI